MDDETRLLMETFRLVWERASDWWDTLRFTMHNTKTWVGGIHGSKDNGLLRQYSDVCECMCMMVLMMPRQKKHKFYFKSKSRPRKQRSIRKLSLSLSLLKESLSDCKALASQHSF